MNEPYSIAKVQIRDALREDYLLYFGNPPSNDPITNQLNEEKEEGFKAAVLAVSLTISEDDKVCKDFYDYVVDCAGDVDNA